MEGSEERRRPVEVGHQDETPAYLSAQVGVGAGAPPEVVAAGKVPRPPVVGADEVAGVVDLHDIYKLGVAFQ